VNSDGPIGFPEPVGSIPRTTLASEEFAVAVNRKGGALGLSAGIRSGADTDNREGGGLGKSAGIPSDGKTNNSAEVADSGPQLTLSELTEAIVGMRDDNFLLADIKGLYGK